MKNNWFWDRSQNIYIFPTDTCYGIACSFSDKKNYHKIYKIKKRSLEKPLAILVPDYSWLADNTTLTSEQIAFLKNYDTPFTVLTECPHIHVYLNFEDEEEMYKNKDVYGHIGFRVAHNDIQDQLLSNYGPLWLTSANISGEPELYNPKDIKKQFSYYIEQGIIKNFASENLDTSIQPSDVFGFEWDSLNQVFVRKN